MRRRRRRSIPKPAQSCCARCTLLFVYFQITKARLYCGPCVELERKDANDFFNALARAA